MMSDEINEYMATPGLGGEDDAINRAEMSSSSTTTPPEMGDRMVVMCGDYEVLAEWDGLEWLHLHDDDLQEEQEAVRKFREAQGTEQST